MQQKKDSYPYIHGINRPIPELENLMKLIALLSALSTTVCAAAVKPLVIYGEDNRKEVYEARESFQLLARSTAVMIPNEKIQTHASLPGHYQFSQTTLKEWFDGNSGETPVLNLFSPMSMLSIRLPNAFPLCSDTRFSNQPNPGECSGFLIGPDLLMTAGHCVDSEELCEKNKWVFDYNLEKDTQRAGLAVRKENIYSCKKIAVSFVDEETLEDYGIVQLDRPVTGRQPVALRTESKILDNQSVVVIGSPSGQPIKVTDGAFVRDNTNELYFSANLDSFQGNSGSAVFNADSGLVEGVLVRGEEDYLPNMKRLCLQVNRCKDDACMGEEVNRTTSIPEVANQKALYEAAVTGNLVALKEILEKEIWVDFYTQDGQNALIKASASAQVGAMKMLLAYKADVHHKDANGNTALHELAKVLNKKNRKAFDVLKKAGAKLEEYNNQGETPLIVAIKSFNIFAVKVILSESAGRNNSK